MSLSHPYASFLHKVRKPGQYLGGEPGEHGKRWEDVSLRMCLAFPDLYEIGMSHLGYKILYGILNDQPDILADRAYAAWHDMEKELRAHGERLRSLETSRPLCDFDVVGFSLQFELTYTNVLSMLDLGGIPLRAADRGEDAPLILAGGPVATHAEPLAPFIDAFVIGDGEAKLLEILRSWQLGKEQGLTRTANVARLAQLGGVYVPALYERSLDPDSDFVVVQRPQTDSAPLPIQRTFIPRLDDYPFPTKGPVAATETIFDRVSIEIARGCTEGCRFCQAGMIYRPVRERSPKAVLSALKESIKEGGYDEASLTCLSTADYSAVEPLVHEVIETLQDEEVNFSVSSLRAYGLSEAVLDDMKTQRAGGLTFAPEAGTQRMRDVVNKNVTEAQLMTTAERVFSRGWSKMKLYFMIGLPTEEDEDVRGIAQTGARALEVGKRLRGRRTETRVTVSVSTHVPKPHTPFQWCAMDSISEILRKQRILKEEARYTGIQLRVHASKGSWLEGALARGDVRVADVIESAYRAGARFDSWDESLNLEAWKSGFENCGLEPERWLGTIPTNARLPWDHIDVGLEDGFLVREYKKALKSRLSPPCGKVAGTFVHATNLEDAEAETKRLVCYDCGIACDLSQMREERKGFLAEIGATKKRLNVVRDDVAVAKDLASQRMKERDQGPVARVRIGFKKLGKLAYVGHLDLVRLFPRWFKRADLPLFYSEGFHPKPVMTFGPALSLGIPSYEEFVDVKLRQRDLPTLDALEARLREAHLDGLEVNGVALLGPNDAGINKVVEAANWIAVVAAERLASSRFTTPGDLEACFTQATDELKVVRVIEGVSRDVHVGRYLESIRMATEESRSFVEASESDIVLEITTKLSGQGSARPGEVLEAFAGVDLDPRIVRTRLYGRASDGAAVSLLDLDGLRGRSSLE